MAAIRFMPSNSPMFCLVRVVLRPKFHAPFQERFDAIAAAIKASLHSGNAFISCRTCSVERYFHAMRRGFGDFCSDIFAYEGAVGKERKDKAHSCQGSIQVEEILPQKYFASGKQQEKGSPAAFAWRAISSHAAEDNSFSICRG